jgi:hypothetical protein
MVAISAWQPRATDYGARARADTVAVHCEDLRRRTFRESSEKNVRPGQERRKSRPLPSSIPGPLGYAEAEPLALRVLAVRDSMADTLARKTVAQLVTLYEAWAKPARTAEFRRR